MSELPRLALEAWNRVYEGLADGRDVSFDRPNLLSHIGERVRLDSTKLASLAPRDQRTKVARAIDHTILKPQTSKQDVIKICNEAAQYEFASVCVSGCRAKLARRLLHGTCVKTCAVVGFPNGASTPAAKAFEANELVQAGIDEIDMVINIGQLLEQDYTAVLDDIEAVSGAVRAGSAGNAILKVILECGSLGEKGSLVRKQRIADGCVLSALAGANFVKTSTGFNNFGGAVKEDVELMKTVVGDELEVKASGGVKDFDGAKDILAAGATRIGASAGVDIVGKQHSKSSNTLAPSDVAGLQIADGTLSEGQLVYVQKRKQKNANGIEEELLVVTPKRLKKTKKKSGASTPTDGDDY